MTKRNILIVLAHPDPASFNHALARAAETTLRAEGHTVTLSDLYAQHFGARSGPDDFLSAADPGRFHYQNAQAQAVRDRGFVPEIAREQHRLMAADLVILQFPLWWGSPPAVLKAWLERVLAYGFAYVDGYRFDSGLFRGRRAVLSVTTGGTEARFAPDGVYGPIEAILRPVQRLALEYMGFEVAPAFISYAVPRMTPQERAERLSAWTEEVRALARLPVERDLYPADPLALVEADAWTKRA